MKIEYSNKSVKQLYKLDAATKRRVRAGIDGIMETPPKGDIKAMQSYSDGTRRLRIGKYRIIYKLMVEKDTEILYIIDIRSRGDIYK